jgi:DNA repair protein RadC
MLIKLEETLFIKQSADAIAILKAYFSTLDKVDRDKEHFFCLGLARNNRVKYFDVVSVGTLHAALAEPREVFRRAVMESASSVVLAHNHPSGNEQPSSSDNSITKKMKDAGDLLGIKMLDHIIFSNGDAYYSFADEGQ